MEPHLLRHLLDRVQSGEICVEEAEARVEESYTKRLY